MTIDEFLEARIAEDERAIMKLAEADRRPVLSIVSTVNRPQRLLAECKAKRAILDQHELAGEWCITCEREHPCPTLKIVTAVYSDHPDFDPQWSL